MLNVNCCIPGCAWSTQKAQACGTKRHFFKVLRLELAKTAGEKKHRENLRKMVLSLRDPTKGDKIRRQLHKER